MATDESFTPSGDTAEWMRAQGLSYREIGRLLGIPRSTVQRRLNPVAAAASNQRNREKYAADPGKQQSYSRSYRATVRGRVFAYYGESCACCGTTGDLSIDHVGGGGRRHRSELSANGDLGSYQMYLWLIRHDFPAGFQVLCRPCNASKRTGRQCKLSHEKNGADSGSCSPVSVTRWRDAAPADGVERWLPVRDYEDRYMVSNRGNVLSLPRKVHVGRWRGGPLKLVLNNTYFGVSLSRDGHVEPRHVHVLVLEAFDQPRPDGCEALHGPGGPLDNRWPENLRWGTPTENAADRLRDGTHQRGERQWRHKLTARQVLEIRTRNAAGESYRLLAAEFGVSRSGIMLCVTRRTWAWL